MQVHPDIDIILSSVADGSLRSSLTPEPEIRDTATNVFLRKHDIAPEHATLLRLSYDTDNFCKYHEVSPEEEGAGFVSAQQRVADGIMTRQSGIALFLPIADCIGAVLYHSETRTLMLSHLGRHNLEQQGGKESVEYLSRLGVNPDELHMYLSPAASGTQYPLFSFENRSLHTVAIEQLVGAGVKIENITVDTRDTVTDANLFSHSAALRGDKQPGRHAIVCRIR